jgi:integrase/recombinase XerD
MENGGRLERAKYMPANESPRTTKLYDRTKDEITIGEVERIQLLKARRRFPLVQYVK